MKMPKPIAGESVVGDLPELETQGADVPGDVHRTEHAGGRSEQAEACTEQAEARIEQAEARTDQAVAHTEQAEVRTEQAEDANRTGSNVDRTIRLRFRTQVSTVIRSGEGRNLDSGR
jgi:ATP/maltotriose-dependent transcriptional regulator MalT